MPRRKSKRPRSSWEDDENGLQFWTAERLHSVCDITMREVQLFWEQGTEMQPTLETLISVLVYMRLGISQRQGAGLAEHCLERTTLLKRIDKVAEWIDLNNEKWIDPTVRFLCIPEGFPRCTCIVDGTPIPGRYRGDKVLSKRGKWIDENYSGKAGFIALNSEWWVTIEPVIPIAFRGLVPGRDHDMEFFRRFSDEGLPFWHSLAEMPMADAGYCGTYHLMVPFKAGERSLPDPQGLRGHTPAADDLIGWVVDGTGEFVKSRPIKGESVTYKSYFNHIFSRLRSRIERFFAWMLAWGWTQHTETGTDRVRQFCLITLAFEHFTRRMRYGLLDLTDAQRAACTKWSAVPECGCDLLTVPPGNGLGPVVRFEMARERVRIAEKFWSESFVPTSKRPAKGAKAHRGDKVWSVFARATKMGGIDELETGSDPSDLDGE